MWIMAGSKNARVFPDPVAEMPTMSLPSRAIGQPWLWMGVGALKPCFMTSRSTYSGMEASSKVMAGLGIPSPWMTIWHELRHVVFSWSDRLDTSGCSM